MPASPHDTCFGSPRPMNETPASVRITALADDERSDGMEPPEVVVTPDSDVAVPLPLELIARFERVEYCFDCFVLVITAYRAIRSLDIRYGRRWADNGRERGHRDEEDDDRKSEQAPSGRSRSMTSSVGVQSAAR